VGIAGVVCGYIALSQLKASPGTIKGRRLAIAGLVLNWIAIVISVAYFVAFMVLLATTGLGPSDA
jgi:hypothetical protein